MTIDMHKAASTSVAADPLAPTGKRSLIAILLEAPAVRLMDTFAWLAPALAGSWGAVLFVLGIFGLSTSPLSPFAGPYNTTQLFSIQFNPLLSVIYTVLGVTGLVLLLWRSGARLYLVWLARVSLLVAILGMFAYTQPADNWLGQNGWTIGFSLVVAMAAIW